MSELKLASPAPAPAAARTGAAPRAQGARDPAAPPGSSPFQDALALELGLEPAALPVPGAAAAALAGEDLSAAGETTPAAGARPAADAAADAGAALSLPGAPLLLPGLAATAAQTAAATGAARQAPLAKATLQSNSKPGALPAATEPAVPALPGPFAPAAAAVPGQPPATPGAAAMPAAATAEAIAPGRLARADAAAPAQKSGARPPALAVAADAAAAQRWAAPAEGAVQREAGFAAKLLEQHKSAPAVAAGGLQHAPAAAPAPAAPAPVAVLEARVGERGWDRGLGDKLVWMAGQKQQVAELHLNPPELGPLKITLTLNSDQASAQFVSAHAPVREAIETALPRLREMLADSGITLGDANVSSEASGERAQQEQRAHAGIAADAGAAAAPVERLLRRARGLVDTFA